MKILVIRFSSIGDIVLTSPVLRCLKQQVGAEVHFLTKKNFACIVQSNPYVDKVFGLDRSLYRVIALLRRQDYDYILDLHHNLRSWWVKLALQRPSRSFYKANLEKWLLVNLKVDVMPDRHVVYRYLETAQEFGVRYDGQGLDYFIPSGQEVDTERWEGPSPPFIAFAIGANHATKRLPTDKIAEICRLLEPTCNSPRRSKRCLARRGGCPPGWVSRFQCLWPSDATPKCLYHPASSYCIGARHRSYAHCRSIP